MQLLIVDDHPFMHEYFEGVARAIFQVEGVQRALTLQEGIDAARQSCEIDLVLFDLGLPGYEGVEALEAFQKCFGNFTVIVISSSCDSTTIRECFALGAAGYIPKTSNPKVAEAALRVVAAGGRYIPQELYGEASQSLQRTEVQPHKVSEAEKPRLTSRQWEVLRMIVSGVAGRQIAAQLGISANTVKQHAHAAYVALGVSSRSEALREMRALNIDIEERSAVDKSHPSALTSLTPIAAVSGSG